MDIILAVTELSLLYCVILIYSTEYDWACNFHESMDSNLETSIQCYMEALNKGKDNDNEYLRGLGRKLGNAYNEQGVYYRNVALEMAKEGK